MVELELLIEFRIFDSQSRVLSMAPEVFDIHTVLIDGDLDRPSCAHGYYGMVLRELGPERLGMDLISSLERVGLSF